MVAFKFKTVNIYRWLVICVVSVLITYLSIFQLSKASLYGIFNIFTVDFKDHSNMYLHDSTNRTNDSYLLLKDYSQYEFELLNTKSKIFFIQTSENEDILPRHGCSIEAAARLHRNSRIYVFMRSQYIDLKKGSFNRLQKYINIRFVHFNETAIYSGTALSRLNSIQRTQFIHYFTISHMSDFIRTALLYKYGGIYFDLDVIALKSFTSFTNTVALESTDSVNVAVLVFEKQHLVLDIQMDIQLSSVNKQFNALCWNCMGPMALTNALKRICDNKKLHMHSKDKCQQIDIQPSYAFYPIAYQKIPQFFQRSESVHDIDYFLKNSSIYSIHFFHHMTMNLPLDNGSPFARIAQIYCPYISEQLTARSEYSFKAPTTSKFFVTDFHSLVFYFILSLLFIFVLFLVSIFLSYLTSIRIIILGLRYKLNFMN